jgi:hypothetical protein
MSTTNGQEPDREEIDALLPWYAAGTLDRRQAQQVEAALARDPELARHFELVREELTGTVDSNEMLGAPSARSRDILFARIDAEPARAAHVFHAIGQRITAFAASLSPRALAWSGAAMALVIVVQSGLIGGMLSTPKSGSTYQTASAPAPILASGTFVLVRFASTASAADVTALLEANHATIVEGPRAGGFYRLRVGDAAMPEANLANIVRQLQSSKAVSFVASTR